MSVKEGGSLVFTDTGKIAEHHPKTFTGNEWIDAKNRLVTPGFVDSHTHPAFARTRELEFESRSQGKTYQEIAAAGGGIRNSVRDLREIDESTLTQLIFQRFEAILKYGTTTVEAKSGYGLSLESEVKSLTAITQAAAKLPLRVLRTFLGAHEIPDEYQDHRGGYIRLLKDKMIPHIAKSRLAEFCDVFCEDGVYTPEETKTIFRAAQKMNLGLKLHADEFVSTGGAELAVQVGALSADHLMAISEEGISALANSETVATLLPGTTFFLGASRWAPARKLLDAGATIALASDFNPGSNMSHNMAFIMTLAVIYLHLTPLEAWQAATVGGARALGIASEVGSLASGYAADCVIWNCNNYRQVSYYYGVNQLAQVIFGGKLAISHEPQLSVRT